MTIAVPTACRGLRLDSLLDAAGAWLLALIWIAPLLFAVWASLMPSGHALDFSGSVAPTLDNYQNAWNAAPWGLYFRNTLLLVSFTLVGQLILCTLAGYAFARFEFVGRELVFMLVLLQLFILPEVLIVENYAMISRLSLFDTIAGMGLPYVASAFGIFLLRQAFKSVPVELEEAARIEGCSWLGVLWRVYVPAAKPVYLAYALVSVATHWNNFLWPLIVTNSAETRPVTVGLSLFGAPESGVNISTISAATVMVVAPLMIAFLIFQRQFIQAFLRAGIR
ncbi:carbohydrate ABC transporter membrane protein 2, CUT1 family [Phyllobacterium sp. YR620]|jgi:sn-glycerol 3-phosphate transport system permease protein|uniref:carbohydrate ABC transporter permease n=1 Tax=Phyllobacterium sp. YR620 TaxID=1881066 RepID=UPI0008841EC7|nr:carbohydrate ABC transporter permease [Phyllobacterium sp. YR620]SDP89194.1 carbohydrate ABC transporter membrane protein 2, CUT1 family [Phyllobacterium sp. YR620]